jgi:hypothetical protein
MKFCRSLLPYLIVLLMATVSFAEEPEKTEDATAHTNESGFALIPWDAFFGGGNAFVVGADWVFGGYNFLYVSPCEGLLPRHSWVWTIRTQVLWAPNYGIYLQPAIQYLFIGSNILFGMFKVSVGPEIGYARKVGFEYGGSVRIGTFIDILNFEIGHLMKSDRTYMNIIINIPTGLGIWA